MGTSLDIKVVASVVAAEAALNAAADSRRTYAMYESMYSTKKQAYRLEALQASKQEVLARLDRACGVLERRRQAAFNAACSLKQAAFVAGRRAARLREQAERRTVLADIRQHKALGRLLAALNAVPANAANELAAALEGRRPVLGVGPSHPNAWKDSQTCSVWGDRAHYIDEGDEAEASAMVSAEGDALVAEGRTWSGLRWRVVATENETTAIVVSHYK